EFNHVSIRTQVLHQAGQTHLFRLSGLEGSNFFESTLAVAHVHENKIRKSVPSRVLHPKSLSVTRDFQRGRKISQTSIENEFFILAIHGHHVGVSLTCGSVDISGHDRWNGSLIL